MTPATNTTVHRNEHAELAERQADLVYQALLDAARRIYGSLCPACGGDDGMAAWTWRNVQLAEQNPDKYDKPAFFLRYKEHTHALYVPCDGCNPGGIIQPGYSRVEWPDALVWVVEQKEANPDEVAMMERLEEAI